MDKEQLIHNRESFLAFNRKKIQRFLSLLPSSQTKRILYSLLFFLHTNQPKTPGYVNEITPCGIHGFTPDNDTVRYLKALYPSIQHEKKPEHRFIQMIALIGSAGTIAYNKKSDFDFWVCVDKRSISENRLNLFRQKISKLQEWAESQSGIEVHLFINDINDLKKNVFDEDEDEAFGTTLGALLKDEFYRSSIILAGKTPFWWAVPQETDDKSYDEMWNSFPEMERNELFIDIGNMHDITRDDFIGAALFQIVKSLGNPFKSILKLGVLEKYLFEGEQVLFISQKLKSYVQMRKINTTLLDSYLLMFSEVFNYYSKTIEDTASLNILKINLYLKINPSLSKYTALKSSGKLPYKVLEMYKYIKHWKWNSKFVEDLDNFENWDFLKVKSFWNQVRKFMLISYQKISKLFIDFDIKEKISDSDYTLLSRKIRSYFTSSEEKIEKYISFKETSGEAYLFIQPVRDNNGALLWRLYKRISSQGDEEVTVTLKQDADLFALLSWTAINGLYEKSLSRLTMNTPGSGTDSETIGLLNKMVDTFHGKDLKTKNAYYLNETFALINLIVINYNQIKQNDINQINHLSYTSWGEAYHRNYKNKKSIIKILFSVMQDGIKLKRPFDHYCQFYSPADYSNLLKPIEKCFKNCYENLILSGIPHTRFISRLFNQYIVLTNKNNQIVATEHSSISDLLAEISQSPIGKVNYVLYKNDEPVLDRFEWVVQNSEPEKINIFYEKQKNLSFIYLVNENNNVFVSIKPQNQCQNSLTVYYRFCIETIHNLKKVNPFYYLDDSSVVVKELIANSKGEFRAVIPEMPIRPLPEKQKLYTLYLRKEGTYQLKTPDGSMSAVGVESNIATELMRDATKRRDLLLEFGTNLISSVDLVGFKQNPHINSNIFFREKFRIDNKVSKFLASAGRKG